MSVFRFFGFSALVLSLNLQVHAQSVNDDYERALSAYESQKPDTAFIHLKNALQNAPLHLPSRLLLGKIYYEHGIFSEAEHELMQAMQAGADINLVLPLLGNSLLFQKKSEALLDLEKYYAQLDRYSQFEWHLLAGQAYLQQENVDLAEQEFRRALEKAGNDIRALNTLASYYLEQGQLSDALPLLNKSLSIDADNKKTLMIQARVYRQQNDDEREFHTLQQAYLSDNEDPLVLRELVAALLKRGDKDKALELNETILTQSPNDPTALLIKANWLREQHKDAEAQALLESLSNKLSVANDDKGNVNLLAGITASMLENDEAAVKAFIAHLNLNPEDTYAISLLTQQYLRREEKNKAIDLLQKHYRAVYRDLPLGIQLVSLLLAEQNPFKASQVLTELQRNFADNSQLIILRGQIYSATNQPELAIETLNTVPEGDRDTTFMMLMARMQLALGNISQAESLINQLAGSDETVPLLNLRTALALGQRDFALAKKLARQTQELDPTDSDSRFNLAQATLMLGSIEEATNMLKSLLSDHPAHRLAALTLARISVQTNELQEAQQYLDKRLSYQPDDVDAKELQLNLFIITEQWQQAAKLASELRKRDSLLPKYLLAQAEIFQALKQAELAESNYQLVYEQWANNEAGLRTLLEAQIKAMAWRPAHTTLLRLIKLAPQDSFLKVTMARVALATGDRASTEKILTNLSKQTDVAAQVALLRGDIALQDNELDNAIKYYQQCLKLDPQLHIALVKLYQLAKDKHQEQAFFETANDLLTTRAQPVWVRKLLADAYMNANELGMAEFHYKKLLGTEAFKQSPAILNNLANIYIKDDLDLALETAQLALDTYKGKSASIQDTVGWILALQGNYDEALGYLREASVLDANNPEINYHLGYTLHKLGRRDDATRQLKIATMQENYSGYNDALQLLKSIQ